MRNAVFLEEHMLSAAKANAFSSESTSLDRIAWDISIGTHAQLTKRFSPTHELQQFGIVGLRRQSTELALDYAAGGAIEGKPVALFEHLPLNVHLALLFVYVNIARASHAALTHAARDNSGVASHAATRRQNPYRNFHTVNVFRRGFGAYQDHRVLAIVPRFLYRLVRSEHDLTDSRTRRCR